MKMVLSVFVMILGSFDIAVAVAPPKKVAPDSISQLISELQTPPSNDKTAEVPSLPVENPEPPTPTSISILPRPRPAPPAPAPTPVENPTEPVPTEEPSTPTTISILPLPRPAPNAAPTAPKEIEADPEEPSSTGSVLIDKALAGEASADLLPLWHGYPWQKVRAPKIWTTAGLETLRSAGQVLLESEPADVDWYCPRYRKLSTDERLVFWLRFLSVLAEYESTYNPLRATHDVAVGPEIYSTGLFQISVKSAQQSANGCSMIRHQNDLFQWRRNMACAVRIMSRYMAKDGQIATDPNMDFEGWRGIARYWGPLREPRLKTPEGRKILVKVIEEHRESWQRPSKSHPAYLDDAYRKSGEKRFERFLRLMNMLPICY